MKKGCFFLISFLFCISMIIGFSPDVFAEKSNQPNPIVEIKEEYDVTELFELAQQYEVTLSRMRLILVALELNPSLTIEDTLEMSMNGLTKILQVEHQEEIILKNEVKKGVLEEYTVSFVDYDGTLLKQEAVPALTAATPPPDPYRVGFLFSGWDRYLSSVESDMVVTAKYISGLSYVIVDGNYVKITFYSGYQNDIWIPSVIEGYPVKEIGSGAFSDPESVFSIQKVIIPDSIERIGYHAFRDGALRYNIFAKSESKPEGWEERWVNYPNESYVNVVWGFMEFRSNSEYVYSISLDGTSSILGFVQGYAPTAVSIPSELDGRAVTTIDNNAFAQNLDIQSVHIPKSIEKIGSFAFSFDINLHEFVIEENSNLTVINYRSFAYSGLFSFVIPYSVRLIGPAAFANITSLYSLLFSEGSMIEEIPGYFVAGSGIEEMVIPSSVVRIMDEAFAACYSLEKVYIPNSVEQIASYVFFDCINIQIFAETSEKPEEWSSDFNYPNLPVFWNATFEDYLDF